MRQTGSPSGSLISSSRSRYIVSYGNVLVCMYVLDCRPALSWMNFFQDEPQPGARPKVFIAAASMGWRSVITCRLLPPMKPMPL